MNEKKKEEEAMADRPEIPEFPGEADNNIKDWHRAAFESLRLGEEVGGVWGLFSCFVNGEPTCALVTIDLDERGEEEGYLIRPLFVAVTPDMDLRDHDGEPTEFVEPTPLEEGEEG